MLEWFTTERLLAALNIVFLDILLAGDNAVLIALAVQRLTPQERKLGIMLGSLGAVVLRIVLTYATTLLLAVKFLKLFGGLAILYIAVKLIADSGDEHGEGKSATSFWEAVRLILVADLIMSLDNVLAIAGASKGHMELVIFGLVLSIPLVVFASNFLSKLMDQYPIIVLIGAAILGKVGAEMILTDPWVASVAHVPAVVDYALQALFAVGVVLIGKTLRTRRRAHA